MLSVVRGGNGRRYEKKGKKTCRANVVRRGGSPKGAHTNTGKAHNAKKK